MHTHGFHATERNSLDILSCMLTEDRWFPRTAFRSPHSYPEISSLPPVGILPIQITLKDHSIVHEYHLCEISSG